jgi:cytochrome c-type protein NapB
MKRYGWGLLMIVAVLAAVGCNEEPEIKRPFPIPEPGEPARPLDGDVPEILNTTPAPQVPHTVEEYLPIVKASNKCLDCHFKPRMTDTGERAPDGEAQPIPANHHLALPILPGDNLRMTFGQVYFCVPCHSAAPEAKPLPPGLS